MFTIKATLAAAILLTVLFVPSASAQYIYVANTGEATLSKIDINSNTEVARYATWFTPGSTLPAPSRVIEDGAGNVFVLNRFRPERFPGNPLSPGMHRPVLMKIAPSGVGPTSTGPTALSITDSNANNEIDAGEASDVRIQWAKSIGTPGIDEGAMGRALCMDTSGILWVGMYHTKQYYKVDPITGNMIGGPISTPGHTPYGCQVARDGTLWSTDAANTLVQINTTTNQLKPMINHGPNPGPNYGNSYSISLFNDCGGEQSKVYLSERGLSRTYIAYNPQTGQFNNPPASVPTFPSYSVAVDLDGNILSGAISGQVVKTDPAGTVIWNTSSGIPPAGPTVPMTDLHGLIVDDNNNVWAVDRYGNQLVKYSGLTGKMLVSVPVGREPYTYGNPPPPSCPCAGIGRKTIACEKLSNGVATYPFSFTFTNNSPFSTPATAVDITSTQATNITPSSFVFGTPVPVNGQGTVSGHFSVTNPVPGSQVCLDIRLNAGEGWCCPTQRVCYVLPSCPGCAGVTAAFKCHDGKHMLQLMVTNQGPGTAQGAQIYSNTPGVTVSPQNLTQAFPQNTPVQVALNVTGASPGQAISLNVSLNGPMDPKTGVYDWCCSTTVTLEYPKTFCAITVDGGIFEDLNRDGLRDSSEKPIAGWAVTLTDARGASRTARTDAIGRFAFESVEPGTYRLASPAPPGSRATVPENGVYTVTVGGAQPRRYEFGFAKVSP